MLIATVLPGPNSVTLSGKHCTIFCAALNMNKREGGRKRLKGQSKKGRIKFKLERGAAVLDNGALGTSLLH